MVDRSKVLWFGVATSIFIILIYISDFNKFIDVINRADKLLLVSAIGVGICVIPIWSNSWYHFLNCVGGDKTFFETLKLFMAGNFMNSITPLGQFGGEPFMAYIIKDNSNIEYEKALSAVISADIINTVPIFTFIFGGALYLLLSNSLNSFILEILYIAFLVTLVGGTITYLLWFKSGYIEFRIVWFISILLEKIGVGKVYIEKFEKKMYSLQDSFGKLGKNKRNLVKTAIIAHGFFILQVFSLYLVIRSVGVTTNLTPLYFVLPIAAVAGFTPTPGGSGTYEAVMATALATFLNLDLATALAIGIIFRFTTFWPGILLGYISFLTLPGKKINK